MFSSHCHSGHNRAISRGAPFYRPAKPSPKSVSFNENIERLPSTGGLTTTLPGDNNKGQRERPITERKRELEGLLRRRAVRTSAIRKSAETVISKDDTEDDDGETTKAIIEQGKSGREARARDLKYIDQHVTSPPPSQFALTSGERPGYGSKQRVTEMENSRLRSTLKKHSVNASSLSPSPIFPRPLSSKASSSSSKLVQKANLNVGGAGKLVQPKKLLSTQGIPAFQHSLRNGGLLKS